MVLYVKRLVITLGILVIISLVFYFIINSHLNREFKVLRFRTLNKKQSCNYTFGDYNTIILAIERALNFFQNLNRPLLDAAVGTRVLQAQLTIVLNEFGKHLPAQEHLRLNKLLSRSSSLSQSVLDNFLYKSNNSFYAKITQSQWVRSVELWKMPRVNGWKSKSDMEGYFNRTTIIKKKNYFRDFFRGTLSDECIFQQFFCKSLHISPECKNYFFSNPGSSYTLNHQIIYAIMAEQVLCYFGSIGYLFHDLFQNLCHKSEEFHKMFQDVGGWKQFRKDLCGKAFFLANVVSAKNFTPRYFDLFTEQVAVCSLAGYTNFLNKDWMYKILSWQATEGCFPHRDYDNRMLVTVFSDDDYEDVESPQNVSKTHLLVPEDQLPILKENPITPKSKVNNYKRHRVKRHEQVEFSETGDVCLIHLTSMGVMALSVHLRYAIEICTNELFID